MGETFVANVFRAMVALLPLVTPWATLFWDHLGWGVDGCGVLVSKAAVWINLNCGAHCDGPNKYIAPPKVQ